MEIIANRWEIRSIWPYMLPIVTHPAYDIPLPEGHRFNATKFSGLMQALGSQGVLESSTLHHPKPASPDDLTLVHDPSYVAAISQGSLDRKQLRTLGLNWSTQLRDRSFLSVEGTLEAARLALAHGVACHAAGGTHHAHAGHGAGFCVFNDLAYTAMRLVAEGAVRQVLILDCDVHQGDGTARIALGNGAVFTCSVHCRVNYPEKKATSDWDIELDEGLSDQGYLSILDQTLAGLRSRLSKVDLVLYDAGVDVHARDRLGRLKLSYEGILARDRKVLTHFRSLGIPVATVIGGGYSEDLAEVSHRHSLIFRAAIETL
ncbi:histone deacetylase family protein [Tropicimonas marinistellae]|uniref:histone deacetylase family protein n=1 Tax=Tropicimonas marinistellae TaxID=1739787 RepID=UPI00191B75AC|nr:histone deacetylase [Tropicimonas marinistellae]